jgi:GNAT superfamily N-acetyltransferase
VETRFVGGDDWRAWRELRLRALRDSPNAFASTYERERGFTEDDWRRRLEDPATVSVLAYDGEVAVGMGAAFPDLPGHLHVVAMWTDPGARGRGVGSAVLRAIERWARPQGLRLHLDVSTVNPGARRAYERYGFVATGETRPLREGSDDLVVRLVLDRTPPPG